MQRILSTVSTSLGTQELDSLGAPADSSLVHPHTRGVALLEALDGVSERGTVAVSLDVRQRVEVRLEGEEEGAGLGKAGEGLELDAEVSLEVSEGWSCLLLLSLSFRETHLGDINVRVNNLVVERLDVVAREVVQLAMRLDRPLESQHHISTLVLTFCLHTGLPASILPKKRSMLGPILSYEGTGA
jgi:hypothetical protein